VQLKHDEDKMIGYERAGLLFIFNFHPEKSFTDYRVGVSKPGTYSVVLHSDRPEFGGFDRIDEKNTHVAQNVPWDDMKYSIQIYAPSRVALVFAVKP
jgi:1,4-alpha-glucan branching enzyme